MVHKAITIFTLASTCTTKEDDDQGYIVQEKHHIRL